VLQRIVSLDPFVNNKSVKVVHNAKFELKFLLQNEVELKGQIFDSMYADKLLHAGIRRHSSTLEHLAQFYLKRPLDKEQQNSDWSGDLTADQLAYAAVDAEILLPLREKLISRLKSQKLIEVAQLEFDCVWAMAQMELAGIRLEVDRRQNYCQLIQQNIGQYQAKLQRHCAEWSQKEDQPINLRSTQQLQAALALLGIQVKSTRQSTLEAKSDSVVVANLL
jgi:ribonuclease D